MAKGTRSSKTERKPDPAAGGGASTPSPAAAAGGTQSGAVAAARGSTDATVATQQTPAVTDSTRQSGQAPGPEQIARRAYQLFLERGGEHGRDQDDWLTAERELRGARR